MKKLLYILLFPLAVACKKDSTAATAKLPEPDAAAIADAYPFVTAASMILKDTGTVYKLGLVPYASFFRFDRSMANGDLFYATIQRSVKDFTPLKFYLLNNGTGKVVAITTPTKEEVAQFDKQWQ